MHALLLVEDKYKVFALLEKGVNYCRPHFSMYVWGEFKSFSLEVGDNLICSCVSHVTYLPLRVANSDVICESSLVSR